MSYYEVSLDGKLNHETIAFLRSISEDFDLENQVVKLKDIEGVKVFSEFEKWDKNIDLPLFLKKMGVEEDFTWNYYRNPDELGMIVEEIRINYHGMVFKPYFVLEIDKNYNRLTRLMCVFKRKRIHPSSLFEIILNLEYNFISNKKEFWRAGNQKNDILKAEINGGNLYLKNISTEEVIVKSVSIRNSPNKTTLFKTCKTLKTNDFDWLMHIENQAFVEEIEVFFNGELIKLS